MELANWYLPLKRGALWTENFQIWGLVNWKFPNSGACELKISKFGGLWAEISAKIKAVEAKIPKFSQKLNLFLNWPFCLKWDPCELQERREKPLQGRTSPYPLSRSVPLPGLQHLGDTLNTFTFLKIAWGRGESSVHLRGYCTPDQFCDCLCIFLKKYNTLVTSKIRFL